MKNIYPYLYDERIKYLDYINKYFSGNKCDNVSLDSRNLMLEREKECEEFATNYLGCNLELELNNIFDELTKVFIDKLIDEIKKDDFNRLFIWSYGQYQIGASYFHKNFHAEAIRHIDLSITGDSLNCGNPVDYRLHMTLGLFLLGQYSSTNSECIDLDRAVECFDMASKLCDVEEDLKIILLLKAYSLHCVGRLDESLKIILDLESNHTNGYSWHELKLLHFKIKCICAKSMYPEDLDDIAKDKLNNLYSICCDVGLVEFRIELLDWISDKNSDILLEYNHIKELILKSLESLCDNGFEDLDEFYPESEPIDFSTIVSSRNQLKNIIKIKDDLISEITDISKSIKKDSDNYKYSIDQKKSDILEQVKNELNTRNIKRSIENNKEFDPERVKFSFLISVVGYFPIGFILILIVGMNKTEGQLNELPKLLLIIFGIPMILIFIIAYEIYKVKPSAISEKELLDLTEKRIQSNVYIHQNSIIYLEKIDKCKFLNSILMDLINMEKRPIPKSYINISYV